MSQKKLREWKFLRGWHGWRGSIKFGADQNFGVGGVSGVSLKNFATGRKVGVGLKAIFFMFRSFSLYFK